ncbi:YceI family protein [Pontimicrobium aquaticum]|uniref:YceI family protein n=1 Tax=Pontimicrobium aquaticum TaxID=2565367 RepID=A0A4U0F1E5_9FLAO|nr:YceI family protein [Pontimicrobium aquaticum]TJY36432.1 YceI family protein [Pontimicrobium aquaticum]
MKKSIFKFFTIAMLSLAIVSCKNSAEEAKTTEAAEATEAQVTSTKYIANPAETTIEWAGYKPTGQHNGTIQLDSGVFTVNNGQIESGTFIIDMASLKDNDGSARLEGHLKSADFFDVEKHPNAAFEVTGFEEVDGKMMLSGNLKLKEKENNVTFPVTLSEDGDTFTVTSDMFTIDRSKWNVKYGSKSFFDNLGDKFINDDIELKITVKAKKS